MQGHFTWGSHPGIAGQHFLFTIVAYPGYLGSLRGMWESVVGWETLEGEVSCGLSKIERELGAGGNWRLLA